jgi:hypothetical protein
MRILVTLFKVIIGLAIAIPVGILALALTVGIVGTVIGLAIAALKLACVAFAGYGLFRVARHVLAPAPKMPPIRELPPRDPYYEAAMRDLDMELGGPARR